jgi:hypothetical protein
MTNLAKLLTDNVNGSTFISIDTVTTPKLAGGKSNLMQGRVTKHQTGSSVMVFQNKLIHAYEAMVCRRLGNEGKPSEFSVGPRSWGVRVPNTCFVEHKGQHYIEVIFLSAGVVHYELDGVRVDTNTIIGLSGSAPSAPSAQGGLDDKVIIRTFKADSIVGIRINKQSHKQLTFSL